MCCLAETGIVRPRTAAWHRRTTMQWLLLAIIVGALLLTATRYPKTAYALLVVLLGASIVLYVTSKQEGKGDRALINPDQVILENVEFLPGYADSFDFIGRITNRSPVNTLREARVEIFLLDCPTGSDADDQCATMGHLVERMIIRVPPQQSRDFQRSLHFGQVRAQGTLKWRYTVVGIQAM